MAFSLNKVQLIGNLGQDAETRFTQNNIPVTSFSIATTRSYKGKDDNWVNETTWHNIVAWNLSEFYQKALKKGKKFYIEGRLQTRSYEDKEGIKRYVTEIVADNYSGIIPLDSREGGSSNDYSTSQDSGNYNPSSSSFDSGEASNDEDLPF
ncbi:MAG: single-stranded DNA-binding protein [Melioribacteraceae bacterium]|jgi:single-strand DNA-binding protein|nr:single-stranded DNA-binding protein [Ignavibacteriota bacterium]MBZ0183196.1 single-stranded DNA-binding protein [Melioribacteraceae bacterium]